MALAYELRLQDDNYEYKPEMEFEPLERNKKLIDYNLEGFVFLEIDNF